MFQFAEASIRLLKEDEGGRGISIDPAEGPFSPHMRFGQPQTYVGVETVAVPGPIQPGHEARIVFRVLLSSADQPAPVIGEAFELIDAGGLIGYGMVQRIWSGEPDFPDDLWGGDGHSSHPPEP